MRNSLKFFWLSTFIFLFIFSSNHPNAHATSMEGVEILGLVADGFDYFELIEVKGNLKRFGCNFTLAGLELEVASYYGEGKVKKVNTSVLIPNVNPTDYDCIFIPGGSVKNLIESQEVLNLVKNAYTNGTLLAAVCHGPLVLAEANVINSSEVTGHIEIKDALKSAGGIFINTDVCVDGKIITGNWPYFWEISIAIAEVLGYYETNLPVIGDFEIITNNSGFEFNFNISVVASDDTSIFKIIVKIFDSTDEGERLDSFPEYSIQLIASSNNVFLGGTSLKPGNYCCDIEIEDLYGNKLTLSDANVLSLSNPLNTLSTPYIPFSILFLSLIAYIKWKRKG